MAATLAEIQALADKAVETYRLGMLAMFDAFAVDVAAFATAADESDLGDHIKRAIAEKMYADIDTAIPDGKIEAIMTAAAAKGE